MELYLLFIHFQSSQYHQFAIFCLFKLFVLNQSNNDLVAIFFFHFIFILSKRLFWYQISKTCVLKTYFIKIVMLQSCNGGYILIVIGFDERFVWYTSPSIMNCTIMRQSKQNYRFTIIKGACTMFQWLDLNSKIVTFDKQ